MQGETLRSILEFVGAGSFLFIAGVSKGWRQIYDSIEHCPPSDCGTRSKSPAQATLVSAVFASPARVQLAATGEHALRLESRRVEMLAGRYGDLATLCAAKQLGLLLSVHLLKSIARAGHHTELMWACVDERADLLDNILDAAAASGNVGLLKWLRACGCKFTNATSSAAAASGHLPTVTYLHSVGCTFSARTCDSAAVAGHLVILQWLRLKGCQWDARWVAIAAARAHDVPMPAWLQEQGVQFDEETCFEAAWSDHVDTLHWLREQGCPCDLDDICWRAARSGDINVLQYAYKHGGRAELTADRQAYLLSLACSQGHTAVAEFLLQQGVDWPTELTAERGPGSTRWTAASLSWARAHGCTATLSECVQKQLAETAAMEASSSADGAASDDAWSD
jgi:hypothetical protein